MNRLQLAKKRIMMALAIALCSSSFLVTKADAQRITDKLDRGLVAVPATTGNFISWRVLGEEYYDVTYNLYCNGTLIAQNLKTSNYTHASGNASSKYRVSAVVRGKEQSLSSEVSRWTDGCLTIPVQKITGRDGTDVTSNYTLNDISLGDLDGDGVAEFIVKRPCSVASDPTQSNCFHVLDAYNHKGTRLWWIDLGPNMLAGADEQWDCVCYDWDQDGKAEVLLRIQDNAYIHFADGTTELIGSSTVDTRWSGIEYTSSGNEYLLYLNGETGKPYQIGPSSHPDYMDYPLTRGNSSDWDTNGGIVGHRSTKHYFGAPFLDGRHASIFLGRGCYTKHKMAAFDVDPSSHKLTQRWAWNCSASGPWMGQGYHNFQIADVDWDGKDEIVFGSMVIDDNGKGLSTTGLGHGDSQHCSDFDPYRKYQEQFCCNEDATGMNYRNALTSELYYRYASGGDDGRALCDNFTDDYPGSQGRSVSTGMISTCADKEISELGGDAFIGWGDLNQRIYWDGDLCDEYFDSPGTEGYGAIYKPASQSASGGRWNFQNTKCNNWSKNNPGAICDIYGDWREELVMRKSDNTAILVYTTNIPTEYRIPTLWSDTQYRNAMVWQSMGYNQPPHKSYFLGKMEGITTAPPTNTMTGRKEIANGGTITSEDEHLLICETNDTKISIQDGAAPYMVTFNVPSSVEGTAASECTTKTTAIKYNYYTCDVTGGALTGSMRLVKQGDGILKLPKVDMTYTGETNIWAGTLSFDGTLKKSPLWLNRFAELNSNGGEFASIKADYGSVIRPGGADSMGDITVDSTLFLGFGSRVVFDLYSDGMKADKVNTKTLRIEKKTSDAWLKYGPKYIQPVIEVVEHKKDGESTLTAGDYIIGKVDSLVGSLSNVKIEGVTDLKTSLYVDDDNNLILSLGSVRGASEIVWTGSASNVWDFAKTENFYLASDEAKTPDYFVKKDVVDFNDAATKVAVTIDEDLAPDTIKVNSSKNYTFSGIGAITSGSLVKEGTGTLTISTDNSYKGGNFLKGGIVKVSSLANANKAEGNLGGVTTASNKFTMENGATLMTTATVTNGSPIKFIGTEGGVINNSADFVQNAAFLGTVLTKKGSGWMKTYTSGAGLSKMIIAGGTVVNSNGNVAQTVEFQNGALTDNQATTNTITVPSGKTGSWTLCNSTTFSNKITGEGTLSIYCPVIAGSGWYATRTHIACNFSSFTGTLKPNAVTTADGRFTLDTSNGPVNGTVDIPSGVIVQNTGKTFRMGKVTGSGSLGGYASFSNNGGNGINIWQAGNDENFTFAGKVTSDARFAKLGTGKMTVSGAWDNSGTVTVNTGELHITNTGALGTGTLTVAKGATFSGVTGTGKTMTNSATTVNGTIQVGALANSFTGNLDFNGKNLTIGSTGTLRLGLRKAVEDSGTTLSGAAVKNIGTLKFTTGSQISVFLYSSYTPAAGDILRLWSDVNTVSGTPTVVCDTEGIVFDTSRISEGLLIVSADSPLFTGIDNIASDETVEVQVVSVAGTVADTFTCPMGAVKSTFAKSGVANGIYLLNVKSETGKNGTLKLRK